VPLGVVVGYGITAIFDAELGTWRYSYHAQAGVYVILFILFVIIPKDYIEDDKEEEEEQEKNNQEYDYVKETFGNQQIDEEVDEFDDGYLSNSDNGYE